jgi:SAM-dependent methyltransferase
MSRMPFAQVVRQYRQMEPDGADTWNPLRSDRELHHRLALYELLCRALRRCPGGLPDLRVLDVGCGNGRSTRMYLDFGIRPGQLTGVDLRPGALDLARQAHSGIRFLAVKDGVFPLGTGSMDWVSLCTVLSSIGGSGARRLIAEEVLRVLAPGGFLFYFDRLTAHGFAGGDRLDPISCFPGLTKLWDEEVRLGTDPLGAPGGGWLGRLLRPLGLASLPLASHRFCLLQRGP